MIDPGELELLGRQVELGPLATYSIGFLLVWLLAAASSAFTCFLQIDSGQKPAGGAR